jgi:hypothetical protein
MIYNWEISQWFKGQGQDQFQVQGQGQSTINNLINFNQIWVSKRKRKYCGKNITIR